MKFMNQKIFFQQWRVRFSRLFIWDDLVATSKTFLWFDLAHVGWVRTNKIREDDLGWFPEVLCFLNLLPGAKKNPGCEMVILLYFSTFFVCLWSCIVFSPWCIHFYIVVFFFHSYLGISPNFTHVFFSSRCLDHHLDLYIENLASHPKVAPSTGWAPTNQLYLEWNNFTFYLSVPGIQHVNNSYHKVGPRIQY